MGKVGLISSVEIILKSRIIFPDIVEQSCPVAQFASAKLTGKLLGHLCYCLQMILQTMPMTTLVRRVGSRAMVHSLHDRLLHPVMSTDHELLSDLDLGLRKLH